MKRIFAFSTLATALLIGVPALADEHKAAASDTLTGEVVDLNCYLGHGGMGKDHAKCAKQCIKKGLPVGLLTEKGEIYLAVGPDHNKANDLLVEKASETVTVVGEVSEKSGMKLIAVHEILKK